MLLLLFLLPLTPAYQFKTFKLKITTVDEKGKPLPSCELEVSSSGFLGSEKYVTDKKGNTTFTWQALKSMEITCRRRDFATQHISFENMDKLSPSDTVKRVVVMKSTLGKK